MVQLKKEDKLKALIDKKLGDRLFISVSETTLLFGIAKTTLLGLFAKGKFQQLILGTRLVRIESKVIEEMFSLSQTLPGVKTQPKKLYSLEKEDCYSIGEIVKRFQISESTVYKHIRKYSIPTRQIGKYVYVSYGKMFVDTNFEGDYLWDGKYGGRPVASGEYWYIIDIPSDGVSAARKFIGFVAVRN